MQSPEAGHVSSQLPAEQSIVHGDEVHAPVQLPDEQGHVPPEHGALERGAPVPGSGQRALRSGYLHHQPRLRSRRTR